MWYRINMGELTAYAKQKSVEGVLWVVWKSSTIHSSRR